MTGQTSSFTVHCEWSREMFAQAGSSKEGSGFEIWSTMEEELAALTGDDIEYETLIEDSEALDLNVTSCKFAQFFKELDEPVPGAIFDLRSRSPHGCRISSTSPPGYR